MLPFIRTASGGPRPPGGPAPSFSSTLGESAPGLRHGAERVLAAMVKNLQAMAGQATVVDGLVAGFAAMPMADVALAHRPEQIALSLTCAHGIMLATLDPTMVYTIVELLAGGSGNEPLPELPRAVTAIDGQYAQTLVALAAAAIESEWKEQGFGTVRIGRLDNGLASDSCGPRVLQVGALSLAITLFGQRGTMRLMLPPSALHAFRDTSEPEAEAIRQPDPMWTDHLRREVGQAPVRVEAFLPVQDLTLAAVSRLRVGQLLAIRTSAKSQVSLVADNRALYRGELGVEENRYAIRVGDKIVERVRPRPAAVDARHKKPFSPDMYRAS